MNRAIYYKQCLEDRWRGESGHFHRALHDAGHESLPGRDGPNTFGRLKVLEQWVEQNRKPTEIVASHLKSGQVDKTRPTCPYPQVAKYNGTGSTDDAASFKMRRFYKIDDSDDSFCDRSGRVC